MQKKEPSNPPSKGSIKEFVPTSADISDVFADMSGNAPDNTPPPDDVTPPPTQQNDTLPPEEEVIDVKNFVPDDIDIDTGKKKPKKGDKPPVEKEHTSEIRKQLEKVNAEKKTVEDELAKLREQLQGGEGRYKELESNFTAMADQFEEFRKQHALGDPRQLPEVQEVLGSFRKSLRGLQTEMEDDGVESAAELQSWIEQVVPQFMYAAAADDSGKRDDEKYQLELARIRGEASSKFGPEYVRHIMRHVREGAENAFKVADIVQKAKADVPAHQYKEQLRIYQAQEKDFEEIDRKAFNPPEDLRQNDPLNVSVILRAMIDGSEEVKKVAQNAKLATKLGMLPVKPVDPSSVEPERLQDVITSALNTHSAHFKKIREVLPEALVARAVLPAMWKRLQELENAVKGSREVPKPKLNEEQNLQPEDEEIDVRNFNPTNPLIEEFERGNKMR